jgi:hypothetical protein
MQILLGQDCFSSGISKINNTFPHSMLYVVENCRFVNLRKHIKHVEVSKMHDRKYYPVGIPHYNEYQESRNCITLTKPKSDSRTL